MLVVTPDDAGKSLLQFLKGSIQEKISVREIKRLIEANHAQVNGKVERHASQKLKKGDKVNFRVSPLEKPKEAEDNRILFEDDYYLIYNKPPGITSEALAAYYPDYEIAHRLDKETSGLVTFAKTSVAAEKIKGLFKSRKIHKVYHVIVDGVPRLKKGTVESFIGRVSARGDYVLWGSVEEENGRAAKTHWRVLKEGKSASLIECEPVTGRTHQIRVHMKDIGHPVLGDYRYQRQFRSPFLPNRFMLHAKTLTFIHPFTEQKLIVEAPIPEDFTKALRLCVT